MSEPKEENWEPDPVVYNANRGKVPVDELRQYAGEWVAWSFDGTQVLGHSPDSIALNALLEAAGIDPHRAVFEMIPLVEYESY